MGRIKTRLVKSIAHKLVKEHGNEFTPEFEKNKELVMRYTTAGSSKMRNLIAGCIARLVKQKIILEVCPTSNLCNSILKNMDELYTTIRAFVDNGVRFTINTDGPEMYRTSVLKEEEFLLAHGIMSEKELAQCMRWAFEGAFVRPRAKVNGDKKR